MKDTKMKIKKIGASVLDARNIKIRGSVVDERHIKMKLMKIRACVVDARQTKHENKE